MDFFGNINDLIDCFDDVEKQSILLFADDIIIFSDDESDVKNILRKLEAHQKENSYIFNTKKCFYMSATQRNIYINNEKLERKDKIKYLGLYFNNKGIDINRNITETQRKVLQVNNKIKRIYKLTIKNINPYLLLQL